LWQILKVICERGKEMLHLLETKYQAGMMQSNPEHKMLIVQHPSHQIWLHTRCR
jgi:hypothetical protein